MACHWCGERHGVDQLCQRAQRGMTRRSFGFLFGAGLAASMMAIRGVEGVATPDTMATSLSFDGKRPSWLDVYQSPNPNGPFKKIGSLDVSTGASSLPPLTKGGYIRVTGCFAGGIVIGTSYDLTGSSVSVLLDHSTRRSLK